jgi:hypothetical protein
MKQSYFFLLLSAILALGCNSAPSSNGNADESNSGTANEAVDYTIVPGKSIGKISIENSTKAGIIAAYGAENVKEDSVYVGEGFSLPGLHVFPGTKNEMQIAFDAEISGDKATYAEVSGEGSDWKTASGLKVGSTLQEAVAANGKDFIFSGFGWDYGGTVTSWEGGNLEGLLVRLDMTNADALTEKFAGEQPVNSSDPGLAPVGIKVGSISVRF